MASILYEISGTDKILCEYFPKAGISPKFVCKTAFDMLREASPDSNTYKLCQELGSECSRKNHVSFWRFYGMRMDMFSTVSGSCFRTSTENGKAVWSHSITRVVSPSSSLFWTEGLYQLMKSYFNESSKALNAHIWKNDSPLFRYPCRQCFHTEISVRTQQFRKRGPQLQILPVLVSVHEITSNYHVNLCGALSCCRIFLILSGGRSTLKNTTF